MSGLVFIALFTRQGNARSQYSDRVAVDKNAELTLRLLRRGPDCDLVTGGSNLTLGFAADFGVLDDFGADLSMGGFDKVGVEGTLCTCLFSL